MADYKVERAIELEQGLIDLQPIPAGKMGVSHDAPQTCVLVRAASVRKHWRGPLCFYRRKWGRMQGESSRTAIIDTIAKSAADKSHHGGTETRRQAIEPRINARNAN